MADKTTPPDPHLGVFEVSDRLVRILQGMVFAVPALAGFARAISALVNDMNGLRADLYPDQAKMAQQAADDAAVEAMAQAKVEAAQNAGSPAAIAAALAAHSEGVVAANTVGAEAAAANADAAKEAADKAAALDKAATARAKEILWGTEKPVTRPLEPTDKKVPAKVA